MNIATKAFYATSILLALVFGVAMNPSHALAEIVTNGPPSPVVTRYIRPFPNVLYPTNASPALIRLAKKFSATFGFMEPESAITRPGCETWLAIRPNKSRPDVPYYSVSVGNGGDTFLIASSEELLEKAMDSLKASAQSEAGQLVVPVGDYTYYEKQ